MDPRPGGSSNPLAAASQDLELLESGDLDPQAEVEVFGRIHATLATALSGAATEGASRPPAPGR